MLPVLLTGNPGFIGSRRTLLIKPAFEIVFNNSRLAVRKTTVNKNSRSESLNILLFPVGSAGDVYPHLGLGRALRDRGHRVTLLTSGYFRETAEREGFDFVDLIPEEEFLRLAGNPCSGIPCVARKPSWSCLP